MIVLTQFLQCLQKHFTIQTNERTNIMGAILNNGDDNIEEDIIDTIISVMKYLHQHRGSTR
jgi:hypothetical protein